MRAESDNFVSRPIAKRVDAHEIENEQRNKHQRLLPIVPGAVARQGMAQDQIPDACLGGRDPYPFFP